MSDKQFKPVTVFIIQFINILIVFLEIVIFLRLLLKLLGASEQSEFIKWFYGISSILVTPFANAFPSIGLKTGTFESSSLFAMIIFGITTFLVIFLVRSIDKD